MKWSRDASPQPSLLRVDNRGLKELNDIAGWIFKQNLISTEPDGYVVAEVDALLPQTFDVALKILRIQNQAIPSAGSGLVTVRHWLRSAPGPGRRAEELDASAGERGKVGSGLDFNLKAKPGIKGH